jgi:hypothetical protein
MQIPSRKSGLLYLKNTAMKRIFIMFSLACTMALALMSCEKEVKRVAAETNVGSDKARLKVNYVSAYNSNNPGIQVKLNSTRVSNVLAFRTPFPGGGFNTGGGSTNDYLEVTPGQTELKISVPNVGKETDSVTLFTSGLSLSAGKNYSAHVTDTGANTKVALLEDDLTPAAYGKSKYRFVNLMPNVPAIDLYYGTTLVASNVAYLASSPYFELPLPVTSLTWSTRETGASPTSTALATYLSASTSSNRRVYTVFASGYKGISGTTNPRRPFVSFILNY